MGLKHHQYADDTQLYFAVSEYHQEMYVVSPGLGFSSMTFYLTQLSQKSLQSELPPSVALPSARARWQSLEHRRRSLITSAHSAYKLTQICRLMRKSMQFADRVTITSELCDRSVTICRPILLRQWLVPSSVHVLTTLTRSFTTSQIRTFRSYRGYKTISHVLC